MLTISKKIKLIFLSILFTAATSPAAIAGELILPSLQGPLVSILIEKKNVTAKDKQKNISYNVADNISQYLKRADDIRLISNESGPKAELFIVLARQYSRPAAMGQGYCGAGYEDYLLLVEILERKIVLRDQFLLQSCLKNISMFIDHGDDHPSNGFKLEQDGSLSYRLVDDNYDKKRIIKINERHFKTLLVPSTTQ